MLVQLCKFSYFGKITQKYIAMGYQKHQVYLSLFENSIFQIKCSVYLDVFKVLKDLSKNTKKN